MTPESLAKVIGVTQADPWTWAHEEPCQDIPSIDSECLLSVIVVHNGYRWLKSCLDSLSRSTIRPGYIVAVDAGSADKSHELLCEAKERGIIDAIVEGKADEGFGSNIEIALAAHRRDEHSWLWMLHDDVELDQNACQQMLIAAADYEDPSEENGVKPVILVPKLLQPRRRNHPDQMSAIGESITSFGTQVSHVDCGDIDQGQQESMDVLGASTAGLCISFAAWDALGGFDERLLLFRDGIDLGWRAHEHSIPVKTVPPAALRHHQSGRRGFRRSSLAPDSFEYDRYAGMATVLLHSPHPRRRYWTMVIVSWLKALAYLLGKSLPLALAQIAAVRRLGSLRAHLDGSDSPKVVVDARLFPRPGWGIRRFADNIGGYFWDRYCDFIETADESGGKLDELTSEDYAAEQKRRIWLAPWMIAIIVMIVTSLIASAHLLGSGYLTGPHLLAPPSTLSDLWDAALRPEAGLKGANAPWLILAALASTFTFGKPALAIAIVICCGPLFAATTAYRFFSSISGHDYFTAVISMAWGLLLVTSGAIGQGSVDVIITAIFIPLFALNCARWYNDQTTALAAWRIPALLAIVIAVITSMIPAFWLFSTVVALFICRQRTRWKEGLIVIFAPPLLWAPWLIRLAYDPGRLLVGIDPAAQPLSAPLSIGRILIGSATAPAWVALSVYGLIWSVTIVGACLRTSLPSAHRYALISVAFAAPCCALLAHHIVIEVTQTPVRIDPTWITLLGMFCAMTLIVSGVGRRREQSVDDSIEDLQHKEILMGIRRLVTLMLAIAVAISALWWIVGGAGQVSKTTSSLPNYVDAIQDSPRLTRTLMVQIADGQARFNLVDRDHPRWGSGEIPLIGNEDSLTKDILQVAQQVSQGQPSQDLAERLSELAIGHIWLQGVSEETITALTSIADLTAARIDENTWLLTNTLNPSRYAIVKSDGRYRFVDSSTIDHSEDGDLLVLSEPRDRSWTVRLGEETLEAIDTYRWMQTLDLDSQSGSLTVQLGTKPLYLIWTTLAWFMVIIMALPTARQPHSPRRAYASEGRGKDDE